LKIKMFSKIFRGTNFFEQEKMKHNSEISNAGRPAAFFNTSSGILLLLSFFALLGFGAWFYQTQERTMQREVEKNLTAIARLKADQIIAWRKDQLEDAGMIVNPFLLADILRFIADPGGDNEKGLKMRFQSLADQHDYADILLVRSDGKELLSLSENRDFHEGYLPALALAFKGKNLCSQTCTGSPRISLRISPLSHPFSQGTGRMRDCP